MLPDVRRARMQIASRSPTKGERERLSRKKEKERGSDIMLQLPSCGSVQILPRDFVRLRAPVALFTLKPGNE